MFIVNRLELPISNSATSFFGYLILLGYTKKPMTFLTGVNPKLYYEKVLLYSKNFLIKAVAKIRFLGLT